MPKKTLAEQLAIHKAKVKNQNPGGWRRSDLRAKNIRKAKKL
jgi:hypothetical protein